jgi:hypothetical protein
MEKPPLSSEPSSSAPASHTAEQQQSHRGPLGLVMLAEFAAFGGALSIYFIVTFPYVQWIFAIYAILDFGITVGYLGGWS